MLSSVTTFARQWLPHGDRLDDASFEERHRILTWFLALHLLPLYLLGLWQHQGAAHAALELAVPALMTVVATRKFIGRRNRGLAVTAGLVWTSAVLVHFSGGTIEAHFHFFIILGFISLYQDWVTFLWTIVYTLISHGVMGTIEPSTMYNHQAAINSPWKWAAIHAAAVAVAAVGQLLAWRFAESERRRTAALAQNLAKEQSSHRESLSRLYVNLARRNQSLLDLQIALIDELERTQEDEQALSRLFGLDHLTTRLRRHTESLLVLAGEQTSRSWSAPVSVYDVARAAAGEVANYERVQVTVDPEVRVPGRMVADLTHLLAELIENAVTYSPPKTTVKITGRNISSGFAVVVEDHGLGMEPEALDEANQRLAQAPMVEAGTERQLGHHVVARLAAKHGLQVGLRPNPEGGTRAAVVLPGKLLRRRAEDGPELDLAESELAEEDPPVRQPRALREGAVTTVAPVETPESAPAPAPASEPAESPLAAPSAAVAAPPDPAPATTPSPAEATGPLPRRTRKSPGEEAPPAASSGAFARPDESTADHEPREASRLGAFQAGVAAARTDEPSPDDEEVDQ
jgi:signal transduction histidine kinase